MRYESNEDKKSTHDRVGVIEFRAITTDQVFFAGREKRTSVSVVECDDQRSSSFVSKLKEFRELVLEDIKEMMQLEGERMMEKDREEEEEDDDDDDDDDENVE